MTPHNDLLPSGHAALTRFRSLLAIALFFATTLVACGDEPTPSAQTESQQAERSSVVAIRPDREPPFPLLLHRIWTYRTSLPDRKLYVESKLGRFFGDILATEWKTTEDNLFWSTSLLLGEDNGSLKDYGSLSSGHLAANEPPRELIPRHLKAGLKRTSKSVIQGDAKRFEFEITVLGKEIVKVPVGRFETWKIEYILKDHPGTEHDLRIWYAPGFGIVKVEKWRESSLGAKSKMPAPIVYELETIDDRATYRPAFPSGPIPINQLPEHVSATDGQLSLFADFKDVRNGWVVLYLINRSGETVRAPTQSNDLYAKLEYQDANQKWQRAQSHVYDTCGNSYDSERIPDDTFMRLMGWMPKEGQPATVRFKIYSELEVASNSAMGRVKPDEIEKARDDVMSVHMGDVDRLRQVLLEPNSLPIKLHLMALYRLRKLPHDQTIPIFESLLADEAKSWAYPDAIAALSRNAPDRLLSIAVEELSVQDSKKRTPLLERAWDLARCDDGRIRAILLADAKNPSSPKLPLLLSALGAMKDADCRQLLQQISLDPKYAEAMRVMAREELEQWYGAPDVDIDALNQVDKNIDDKSELPVP